MARMPAPEALTRVLTSPPQGHGPERKPSTSKLDIACRPDVLMAMVRMPALETLAWVPSPPGAHDAEMAELNAQRGACPASLPPVRLVPGEPHSGSCALKHALQTHLCSVLVLDALRGACPASLPPVRLVPCKQKIRSCSWHKYSNSAVEMVKLDALRGACPASLPPVRRHR